MKKTKPAPANPSGGQTTKKPRKPGTGQHGNQGAKLKPDKRIPVTISFDEEDLKWLDNQPERRNAATRKAVKMWREALLKEMEIES
mgnify:CR=1 FL=1